MAVIFDSPQGLVEGQTFHGISATAPMNPSIGFMPGASGTFRNCTFDGMVHFLEPWAAYSPANRPLDGSGLRFENCLVNGTWVGAVDGAYFDLHGTIDVRHNIGMAIGLCGSRNVFAETCDVTATGVPQTKPDGRLGRTNACVLKFGQMRSGVNVSSVGNVIRGKYQGASEEAVGWDSIYTARQTAVVLEVSGDSVALLHDTGEDFSAGNRVLQHAYCGSVGAHEGNYYLITAQEQVDGVWWLTLDTSRFSTVPPVGSVLVLGPAMADGDWRGTEVHANGASNWAFGYGCNVAFSLWGMCFGNDMRNVLAIADGDAALPASGIHDFSVCTAGYFDTGLPGVRYSMNAHNLWDGATFVDERIDPTIEAVGLGAGTVFYSFGREGVTDPKDTPHGFLGGVGSSYNDMQVDGRTRFQDVHQVSALRIDCDDIGTSYDGYLPQDYRSGVLYWDDAVPSGWYSVWDPTPPYEDAYGEPFVQYELPRFQESEATFTAQDFMAVPAAAHGRNVSAGYAAADGLTAFDFALLLEAPPTPASGHGASVSAGYAAADGLTAFDFELLAPAAASRRRPVLVESGGVTAWR